MQTPQGTPWPGREEARGGLRGPCVPQTPPTHGPSGWRGSGSSHESSRGQGCWTLRPLRPSGSGHLGSVVPRGVPPGAPEVGVQ